MPFSPRRRLAAALFLLFAVPLFSGMARAAAEDEARVILVSIDGLMPDFYLRADELGLEVPNLRRLMAEGAFATGVEPTVPSNTFPGHVTMITGTWTRRHGITDNDRFAPGEPNHRQLFHYYFDIADPTLFDAVREAGGSAAAVWWPVTTQAPAGFLLPDVPGDVPERAKFIYSHSTANVRDLLAGPDAVEEVTDALRLELTLEAVRGPYNFIAAHFISLDAAQHDFGPFSPESYAVAETLDGYIGQIMEANAESGFSGETAIVVASDHGFLPIDTGIIPGTLFRALGLIEVNGEGEVEEWQAYPWAGGGLIAVYLKDPADGEARERTDAAIEFLAANEMFGVRRVFREEELDELTGLPGAYAVLAMRSGFGISDSLTMNRLILKPTRTRGLHGFVPVDTPEMRASLLLHGPGIAAGRNLGQVEMVDIAPTVAALLGVDLPGTDGRALADALAAD